MSATHQSWCRQSPKNSAKSPVVDHEEELRRSFLSTQGSPKCARIIANQVGRGGKRPLRLPQCSCAANSHSGCTIVVRRFLSQLAALERDKRACRRYAAVAKRSSALIALCRAQRWARQCTCGPPTRVQSRVCFPTKPKRTTSALCGTAGWPPCTGIGRTNVCRWMPDGSHLAVGNADNSVSESLLFIMSPLCLGFGLLNRLSSLARSRSSTRSY